MKPWGTSIDVITLVEHFAARVHRTSKAGWSFSLDVYSESAIAVDLGCELRLVGGWRGNLLKTKKRGKKQDSEEKDNAEFDDGVPPSVLEELRRGVPSYLLGFPVLQAPKVIRYLFFL